MMIWTGASALALEAGQVPPFQVVHLDGRTFHIPNRYLDTSTQPPAWLRLLPGVDDDSGSILVTVPSDEVAAHVPGYSARNSIGDEDMPLIIAVLNPVELNAYTTPDWIADIWNGTNSFHGQIVEQESDTGLYRVFRESEYDYSWEVLKADPEKSAFGSGYYSVWLGGCLKNTGGWVTGEKASCTSYVLIDNTHIHFRVQSENIKHVDEVREFLKHLINAWSIK